MMRDDCSIHISEATCGLTLGTVKIRGLRQFRVRMRIASLLMNLAAWVCGVSITTEMLEE